MSRPISKMKHATHSKPRKATLARRTKRSAVLVPLDDLQSAIATAGGIAGRKRAAAFLVRAAERCETTRDIFGCCALSAAHREEGEEVGQVTCSTPDGRLFSAMYEGSRWRHPTGFTLVGWFEDEEGSWRDPELVPHRVYALLFAAAVMLSPP